jgi:hypothetical protein
MSTVTLKLSYSKLIVFNVCRPPSSTAESRDAASFSQFIEDCQTLIYIYNTSWLLITGDINMNVDDPTDSNALKFISFFDLANSTYMSHLLHIVIHIPLILSLLLVILLHLLLLPLHPFSIWSCRLFLSFTLIKFPHNLLYLYLNI